MPETTGPKQDRSPAGRFRPGVSGNPAGRPRGSRNRATLIAQDLLDSDSEDLVKTAIKRAKKGDPVALRLCIERLVPPRRSGSAALELPEIEKAEDVAEAARAVIAAAARGELTLAEAREWMALLDKQRAAIETEDLAVRLEVLEAEERKRAGKYGFKK